MWNSIVFGFILLLINITYILSNSPTRQGGFRPTSSSFQRNLEDFYNRNGRPFSPSHGNFPRERPGPFLNPASNRPPPRFHGAGLAPGNQGFPGSLLRDPENIMGQGHQRPNISPFNVKPPTESFLKDHDHLKSPFVRPPQKGPWGPFAGRPIKTPPEDTRFSGRPMPGPHLSPSSHPPTSLSLSSSDLKHKTSFKNGVGGCNTKEGFRFSGETWYANGCRRRKCIHFRGIFFVETDACDTEIYNTTYKCIIEVDIRADYPQCCPRYRCNPDNLGNAVK